MAAGKWTIPKICHYTGMKRGVSKKVHSMNRDEFKKFYREHLAVPVAGFGMAAVLLTSYLCLMTWIAGHVHLMQYSIDLFGR